MKNVLMALIVAIGLSAAASSVEARPYFRSWGGGYGGYGGYNSYYRGGYAPRAYNGGYYNGGYYNRGYAPSYGYSTYRPYYGGNYYYGY